MENQQYKWRQRKKRNSKIVIWIVLVILLSVSGTFVYEGMQEADPQRVAEKYFKEEMGTTEYKVETGDRSLNSQNQFVQEYTFRYVADGKEASQKINMIQQNEKKYGLFEQWGMTSAAGAVRDLELIAPVDSQVLINGVAPGSDEVKADENLSPGAVCYELKGIPEDDCKIQVNGLPFDSYEGMLDGTSSVIDIREMLTVGENAKTQMLETGKSMLNELFTAAVAKETADKLGTLFASAPNKENLLKAITNNLYKEDVLQVKSLSFEKFTAEFGELYYPGKEEDSYIGVEMKMAYTCKYEPAEQETEAETESTEETGETQTKTTAEVSVQKEATFYFKYQDGKCIVTSVEVPGII